MIRRNWIHTALAVALAFVAVPAVAQPAAPAPAVDAASVAALNSMSAYLRTLKTFQVEAATTTDEVLDDGQLVKYSGTTNIVAQFPNKLLADVSSDRNERQYVYDGKTFTLLARRVGYYATVPAPATVRELADVLSAKYDIEVPLSDLFLWGAPGWNSASITSALDLGPGVGRRHDVRALRVPAGRRGLAALDPEGRLPASAQAGHHDDDRSGTSPAHRDLHLEPGAVGERRRLHVHAAQGRQQDRPRRRRQVEGAYT